MGLTDDELLDFDMKQLGGLERAPRRLLEQHGDAYRQQLITARWIDHWAIGLEEDQASQASSTGRDPLYFKGMVAALRDIAAHLRQGDLLPGGVLYEDTLARRLRGD